MQNAIISRAKRSIPNTDVRVGNNARNAVASLSNGFSLGTPGGGSVLVISFVNCMARRLPIRATGPVSVVLGRSAGALSRIIVMNCRRIGGGSLANTITGMGVRSLLGAPTSSFSRALNKHVTKMGMDSNRNVPNKAVGVIVHNGGSLARSGSPLCIVSKFPMRSPTVTTAVGPSSTRSIRILGSTSTATVCNTHNTGNIIVVAAGGKGIKGPRLGCSKDFKFRRIAGAVSVLSTCRFIGLRGRLFPTSARGGCLVRRRNGR